jgi:hypothetical protein
MNYCFNSFNDSNMHLFFISDPDLVMLCPVWGYTDI